MREGKYQEALNLYLEFEKIKSNTDLRKRIAMAYIGLGTMDYENKDYNTAITQFLSALDYDNNSSAAYAFGQSRESLGRRSGGPHPGGWSWL